MKNKLKIVAIVFFILVSILLSAQDTLCLSNKSKVQTNIIEVGLNEVKYKLNSDTNALTYVINKKAISFIKYKNGIVDTIKHIHKTVEVYSDIITINNNTLSYKGRAVSDKKLCVLINTIPDSEKLAFLQKECRKLKLYKMNQSLYTPILLASSMAVLVATSPLARSNQVGPDYTSDVWQMAGAGIITAAVIRIAAFAINKINLNKRHHKRIEIAQLYNN